METKQTSYLTISIFCTTGRDTFSLCLHDPVNALLKANLRHRHTDIEVGPMLKIPGVGFQYVYELIMDNMNMLIKCR